MIGISMLMPASMITCILGEAKAAALVTDGSSR
jgi:hypothetical protein